MASVIRCFAMCPAGAHASLATSSLNIHNTQPRSFTRTWSGACVAPSGGASSPMSCSAARKR